MARAAAPASVVGSHAQEETSNSRHWHSGPRSHRTVATALNTCYGASAAAIPVLEKALKDEGFTLPKKK
jgi:hypothetical protein